MKAGYGRWLLLGGSFALAVFAMTLLLTNVLPTRRRVRDLERERIRLEAENAALEAQRGRLSVEADALLDSWSDAATATSTPVDAYEVEVVANDDDQVVALNDSRRVYTTDETALLLDDLERGRGYLVAVRASNAQGWGPWSPRVGPVTMPSPSGYWLLDRDGGVHSFGTAIPFEGSGVDPDLRWVDAASTAAVEGLWLLADNGVVVALGDARWLGDPQRNGARDGVPTSLAAHPAGGGYWVATDRGAVRSYGTARFRGDLSGLALNAPIVDLVATTTGQGYYLVAGDGGDLLGQHDGHLVAGPNLDLIVGHTDDRIEWFERRVGHIG